MARNLGPEQFIHNFSEEVDNLFALIEAEARSRIESDFTLSVFVSPDVAPLLRSRLRIALYDDILFIYAGMDGDSIWIKGNPYATGNAGVALEKILDAIADLLKTSSMRDRSVHLEMSVPLVLESDVRRALINAGWSKVQFNSGHMSGETITLIA